MFKILFWNLNRKDLRSLVSAAALATDADVLILIENLSTEKETLDTLRVDTGFDFVVPKNWESSRFYFFTKNREVRWGEFHDDDRLSIRSLRYSDQEILLGAVHLVDRRNWGENQQQVQVILLMERLRHHELTHGHDRTLLIGDFNMNPYAPAMNDAAGFNAMMARGCASKKGRKYAFFYNPM